MLLAIAVLILCLLAVLTAVATLSNVAVIIIAGLAALFAVGYLLGYGPRHSVQRPT